MNGAALAAEFGALSAYHLEFIDEAGVAAMAAAGTVAVLLPGAFYALKETRKPPVDLFRKHGVPMAVATDLNPGTSPALSPALMMNMAATLFGLIPEEALAGMTCNAARALGLDAECGMIKEGLAADFGVAHQNPAELSYWIAHPGPERLFIGGRLFANPKVRRHPLEFQRLDARHPLYRAAIRHIDNAPRSLWARRSHFELAGSPILVTEVFLPEVLCLP